eukprot:scaffold128101_cov30-Tisochrysis_lutea.AAC.1
MASTGTRESAHPTTHMRGSCEAASLARTAECAPATSDSAGGLSLGQPFGPHSPHRPETKRAFPAIIELSTDLGEAAASVLAGKRVYEHAGPWEDDAWKAAFAWMADWSRILRLRLVSCCTWAERFVAGGGGGIER